MPQQSIHPVLVDGTPESAVLRYERMLHQAYGAATLDPARRLFDLALLGLGADGLNAALLPGEPVLEKRKQWAAAVPHGRPEIRIAMTYPVIESSVAFLVMGREKTAMLHTIRAGGSQVPAPRIHPVGELIWFVDWAAAGGISLS
jgi:6-phosphogluconolactonase